MSEAFWFWSIATATTAGAVGVLRARSATEAVSWLATCLVAVAGALLALGAAAAALALALLGPAIALAFGVLSVNLTPAATVVVPTGAGRREGLLVALLSSGVLLLVLAAALGTTWRLAVPGARPAATLTGELLGGRFLLALELVAVLAAATLAGSRRLTERFTPSDDRGVCA